MFNQVLPAFRILVYWDVSLVANQGESKTVET
jgi:hypothetical protein